MRFIGDFAEDSSVSFKFNTRDTAGAPITLAGTPTLCVYKHGSATQRTGAEIVLTVEYDSVTGLHDVTIDTSADVFYAAGYDYDVVLTAGTVDSISVVGVCLGTFSIGKAATVANIVETFLSTLRSTYKDAGTIGELFYRPSGNVVTGTSATSFTTDLTEATNDHWKGTYCLFTSGSLAGQVRKVTAYNGTTKALTVEAFTAAPGVGDDFMLVNL